MALGQYSYGFVEHGHKLLNEAGSVLGLQVELSGRLTVVGRKAGSVSGKGRILHISFAFALTHHVLSFQRFSSWKKCQ
jgi:hypothetical protein